jgi:hypothetical protein
MTLDVTKTVNGGKTDVSVTVPKNQNMKMDVKPTGKLKESLNRSNDITTRASKLDEKLAVIINSLEKEKAADNELQQKYPFTSILSESERTKFAALNETEKTKVVNEVSKTPTVESAVIMKLWEKALAKKNSEQPLWITAAPKKYKELYEKCSEVQKSAIDARSEFYELNTQYQINNFWETSGLVETRVAPLNESVVAKPKNEENQINDEFLKTLTEQMKRYNS